MAQRKAKKKRLPRTSASAPPPESTEGWTEQERHWDRVAAAAGKKRFEGLPARPRFTAKEVEDLLRAHELVREGDATARERRERERKTRAS